MSHLDKLLISLEQNSIINAEDKELYRYGFVQGTIMLGNTVITMLLGLCFGLFFESILLMIVDFPLRIYAGGYHARTYKRCFALSFLFVILSLFLVKVFEPSIPLISTTILLSITTICILAPVEDENKPLDSKEKRIYRNKTFFILGIQLFLAVFLWFISIPTVTIVIAVNLLINALMLILGTLLNKTKNA